MKLGKRVLSALLVACLTLSLLPGMAQASDTDHFFRDVSQDSWYREAVDYVYDRGLMSGTSSTSFEPDTTTSRGMIVTILWRLSGSPEAPDKIVYTDVAETAYYAEAVQWASSTGVASGYGGGLFGPDDPITREQLAVMLYHYADIEASGTEPDWTDFTDANKVSSYATDAMAWAISEGLITGTDEELLDPQGNATRAQVAMILMRFVPVLEAAEEHEQDHRPSRPSGGGTKPDPGPDPDPEPPVAEANGDYAITSFTWEDSNATVIVSTKEACTLRVQFVDVDTDEVVAEKQISTEANLLSGEIRLDGIQTEQGYLVRCDLIDDNGGKLCNTYTSLRYTEAYQKFEAKNPTSDEFKDDIVITNEDDKEDGSFAVLAEGAEEIPVSDVKNTLEIEGNVYTFTNTASGQFEEVQPGDVLYLPGAPVEQSVLKVKSIQAVSDGSVVIQAQEDCTLSDFYQYLNIDTTVPVGVSSEDDGSQLRAASIQYAAVDTYGDDPEIDIDETPGVKLEFEPFKHGPLSISGEGTASFHVRIVYDSDNLGENYFEYENAVTMTLEPEVKLTAGYSDKDLAEALGVDEFAIKLFDGEVSTWIPGLSVGAEVKLPVQFNLEAGLTCSAKLETTTGFLYTSVSGYQPIRTRSNTATLDADGGGSISFSARGSVDVNFHNDILKAEAGGEIGVKVTAELAQAGSAEPGAKSYHACLACLDASATVFLNANLGLTYKITDHFKGSIADVELPVLNYHLQDYYCSLENDLDSVFHGEHSSGEGECPNCKYLVTFETQGNNGEAVTGAEVSVTNSSGSTNAVGPSPCSSYFYPGSYTATAIVNRNTAEKYFTVDKAAMTVILKGQNGTLEGTITDGKTGGPVSGAAITVLDGDEVIGTYSSNASGKYLASIPAGSYTLRVSASGYEAATTNFTIDRRQTVDIALQPEQEDAGTLSGTATDKETSDPVSGVTVEAVQAGKVIGTATTGADGSYTMALPAGTYTVTFQAEGYAEQECEVIIAADGAVEQNAVLVPTYGSLAVTVTDKSTASPIQNATVVMTPTNGGQAVSGQTDSSGSYRFDSLRTGEYELMVTYANYAPYTETVTVTDSELTRQITLQKGGKCGESVYWVLDGATLTIYGKGPMYASTDWQTTAIRGDIEKATTLRVEEGVTTIGDNTLGSITNCQVRNISLPNTLVEIGYSAFSSCKNLYSINIPDSVTTIDWNAFNYCIFLKEIHLPANLVTIGTGAFYHCPITSLELPGSVQTIGDKAFMDCGQLKTVTLNEGLQSIGASTFEGCERLMAIHIPESVTSVGAKAFASCDKLEEATLPSQLTVIPDGLFLGDELLTSIDLPEHITEIGENAFSGLALTSIEIPDGVKKIGDSAFSSCPLTSVTLPSQLEEIGSGAFQFCDSLCGDLVLPDSVKVIGGGAFSYTGLSSIRMGAVSQIGTGAFMDPNSYGSVEDPLLHIYYGGTKAQFDAAIHYDGNTKTYKGLGLSGKTIHCTDGEIEIPPAE